MQAITFTAPVHSLQVLMSILKTRLRRFAQVIDARRSAGDGPFLDYFGLVASAPLWGCHQRPVLSVGCKHTVETCQIDSGFWHQSRQVRNEIQRLKEHMGGAPGTAS